MEKFKNMIQSIVNYIVQVASTFYKWLDKQYQIKAREEQRQLAENRIPLLRSEFYQFMVAYPMPAQYGMDVAANLILVTCISTTRYELQIPLKTRETLSPYNLKLQFTKNLEQNLNLCKAELYERCVNGLPMHYQLLPCLHIAEVYQAEPGYIRIIVDLEGC